MAVAALSGYLAERLRRAGAALEQASNQLADLQAFSEHVISSLTGGLATTDIDGPDPELQQGRGGDHRRDGGGGDRAARR